MGVGHLPPERACHAHRREGRSGGNLLEPWDLRSGGRTWGQCPRGVSRSGAGSRAPFTAGAERGRWGADVPHHHADQGGPGEVQGPADNRPNRQRL
uniref:Uncharacterized protein n=1 Tax=Monodon monoceros TaxID=40151 RepID=A0A8C6AZP8_MONMO